MLRWLRPQGLGILSVVLLLLGVVSLLVLHWTEENHNPWAELPAWGLLGTGLLGSLLGYWHHILTQSRERAAHALALSERRSEEYWQQAEAKRREVEDLNGLLEGVAMASQRLLDSTSDSLQEFLEYLGRYAGADRANYFEYHTAPQDGGLRISQRLEWCAPGVGSVIQSSQDLAPYGPWLERLRANRPVIATRGAAEPAMLEYFTERSIQSFVVVPLFVDGGLFGLLGFHDCRGEREWSERELAALQVAAASLTSYIRNNQDRRALAHNEQKFRSLYLEAEARKAQQEKQNRLLDANLSANAVLSQRGTDDSSLLGAVEILGRALDADAAFVKRAETDGQGQTSVSRRLTWNRNGPASDPPTRPPHQPWFEQMRREGFVAASAEHYPPERRAYLLERGVWAFVEAAIWVGGEVWGSIGFTSGQEREWSEDEVRVVQASARALGEALERSEYVKSLQVARDEFQGLYTNSAYRNRLLQTLVETGQASLEWGDAERVEAEVLGRLGEAVGVHRVSVSEFFTHTDGGQTRYSFSDWWEWQAPQMPPQAGPRRQSAEGYAPWMKKLLAGEAVTAQLDHYPAQARHLSEMRIQSMLIVPVMVEGEFWGGAGFGDLRPRVWLEEEIAVLRTAAALLGGMIERERQMTRLQEASRRHLGLFEQSDYLNRLLRSVVEMSQASFDADLSLVGERMLPGLGQTVGASRVYLNRYHPHPHSQAPVFSLQQEWCAPATKVRLEIAQRQNIPLYQPWAEVIRAGEALQVTASEFPPERRYLAEEEEVASILLVPVVVGAEVWGSLGFDDCRRERVWTEQEIGALKTAAALIGSIVERHQSFSALAVSERQNREQARQLELLLKFRQALALDLDPATSVRRSVELVADTFGYDLVSIYMREGDTLVMQHQVGYEQWLQRVPVGDGVMSRCVLSGQPVLVEDASQDPNFVYPMPDIRSNIAVPLQVAGRTVGVLNIESRDIRLGAADLQLLQSIGVQVGLILERANSVQRLREGERTNLRLLEQTRQQARQLELLLKLRDALAEANDTQTTVRRFVEEVHHSFNYGLAAVYWREGLELVALHHLGYHLNHTRIPLGKGITSRCWHSGEAILIQDPTQDPDFLVVSDRVVSAMYVPLRLGGEVVGTVNIESEDRRFDPQDLELLVAVVAQLSLVLERNRAFASLAQSEARFRSLVEASPDGILRIDPATLRIVYANPSALRLLKAERAEQLEGQHLSAIVEPSNRPEIRRRIEQLASSARVPAFQQRLVALDGTGVEVETTAVSVREADRDGYSVVSIVRDVSERRVAQSRIERLAFKDQLTGLNNRAALMNHAEIFLGETPAGLLYFDLDQFKLVNDTYGHSVGDELLVQVAQRLGAVLGEGEYLARVGGDEFVLLVQGDHDKVADLADQIHRLFEAPFSISGTEFRISSSLGAALFPEHGHDLSELLRLADIAMYQAKGAGSKTEFYHPRLEKNTVERLELLQDLRAALVAKTLEVKFQPIVDLADNRWGKLEALARWTDPKRGVVSPDRFIRLAEESGMIRELDRFMLDKACGQIADLDIEVAFNLSPLTLLEAGFVPWLAETLQRHGVRPQRVWLEITEAVMLDNPDRASAHLEALRGLGVRVALDDFGIGYSSMSYLKNLPIDLVKIDRSFVAEIGRSGRAEDVLRGMIGLALSLGMPVLAEGIETEAQAEWLGGVGCRLGQGYLFSHPLPVEQVRTRLEAAASLVLSGK